MGARFTMGQLVATARVAEKMRNDARFDQFVAGCLQRYIQCDWGVLCREDWDLNEYSVENGERLLASYPFPESITEPGEDKLWIITEWDRSCTTVLFPGDY